MTLYCVGAGKSEVIFTDKGQEERVVFNQSPIDVSCQALHPCGRFGAWVIDFVTVSGASGQVQISGYETDIQYFKTVPNAGCRDGNQYNLFFSCNGAERLVYESFSCTNGAPSITNAQFNPASSQPTGLVVKDSEGNELFQRNVSECTFKVNCDDQCPPEHIKCESDHYPGYCCIPCSEVAGELAGITQQLRQII